MLRIPDIAIADPHAAALDPDTVARLEDALEDWTPALAGLLEQLVGRGPLGKGALAEVEYVLGWGGMEAGSGLSARFWYRKGVKWRPGVGSARDFGIGRG
jgi:hypothetical protein